LLIILPQARETYSVILVYASLRFQQQPSNPVAGHLNGHARRRSNRHRRRCAGRTALSIDA